ncbi:exosortase E/protease, VPEID-CTERM system [Pseudoroseicyclus tamaricis]|uniref:Exosortase E/protease, VPEID-CTERM system n=1 Tax=Pseudoroseicyclus tamaricis TaxID=2705421 RepID=A0A6B2K1F4_9RHOB|nr:exosortase E/protease, VPEID-CTERM system [Pseudoroseicyclus tamaricis]NDV02294.1 exosortase E/protease, VPEID-CTERM system [Pseudoroseicyclus tamaricis]
MSTGTESQTYPQRPWPRIALFGLLALAEIAALAVVYQVLADFQCADMGLFAACRALQSLPARALVGLAAAAMLVWARPAGLGALGPRGAPFPWPWVHGVGILLMFAPALIAPSGNLATLGATALALWSVGAVVTGLGWLLWLAAPRDLAALVRSIGPPGALLLLVALLLPDVVRLAGPLWNLQAMAAATLGGAALLLDAMGETVHVDVAAAILGTQTFSVRVANSCSGIEGIVLVLAFGSLYALLFRQTIHLGRFFALVLPLAMLASWLLNMLRIAALVKIGSNGAEELAVGGFHSHAGWIFFCLVALGLVALMETLPWLHRDRPAKSAPRWAEDLAAACIVPFIVFMLTGLVGNAIFPEPELAYPLRMALVALSLWPFRRIYREMICEPSPASLAAGMLIGVVWAITAPAGSGGLMAQLAGLAPAALLGWVMVRVLGTSLIVPLVEEVFFRGYILLDWLDGPGWPRKVLAIAASTLPFALLHGRPVAALLAGLVFAALALRWGRVSDAIWAHVVANFVIALWALAAGDFSLI